MFLTHNDKEPVIHDTAYIAPNAVICGDVTIGSGTSILFGAVITAESGSVVIGKNCVIMENSVIRGTSRHPVRIENNVLIGPHSHLTGCVVKERAFIATGSTVFNNATIGKEAEVRINGIVHVNTTLPDNFTVPIGWIAVGDPCKIFSPGQHEELWKIQKELDFSRTVWGKNANRSEKSIMGAVTESYSRSLCKHRNDSLLSEPSISAQTNNYRPSTIDKQNIIPLSKSEDITAFGKVNYSTSGNTAFIQMDRPEKLNALNEDLWTGLTKSFKKAGSNPKLRAVVLQGSGRAFSAGDDISMMRSWKAGDAALWMKKQADPLVSTMLSFSMPIISVVDGIAAGGGCELLMLSDIVIASDQSRFSIPEGLIGAIPPIGTSLGMGYINRALFRYAVTGETFSASTAKELGMVDIVVSSSDLEATLMDVLEKIGKSAPQSVVKMKETVNRVKQKYIDELNFGKQKLVEAAETGDFKQGMEAFVQGKPPIWKDL